MQSFIALVGKDLTNYKLLVMTEVYRVNEDGLYPKSIGFFKNNDIANAFAGQQSDSNYIKTSEKIVLTDGTTGFTFDNPRKVEFLESEEEVKKIKQHAMSKLSPEEKRLLGLV